MHHLVAKLRARWATVIAGQNHAVSTNLSILMHFRKNARNQTNKNQRGKFRILSHFTYPYAGFYYTKKYSTNHLRTSSSRRRPLQKQSYRSVSSRLLRRRRLSIRPAYGAWMMNKHSSPKPIHILTPREPLLGATPYMRARSNLGVLFF